MNKTTARIVSAFIPFRKARKRIRKQLMREEQVQNHEQDKPNGAVPTAPGPKQAILNGHMFTFNGVVEDDPYASSIRDDFEPEFSRIANELIAADSTCIDIGANIGAKSFIMSRRAADGKIYSIEAGKRVYEALQANVAANAMQNVTAINAVMTDITQSVTFEENSAWGHIGEKGIHESGYALDDLLAKLAVEQVDFIKIDTEGNELRVLKGATATLQKHRLWLYLEFNSFTLVAFGDTSPKTFLEWLFDQFKYVFHVQNGAFGKLRRLEHSDILGLLHENMVNNLCVDDLLATNRESALEEVKALL